MKHTFEAKAHAATRHAASQWMVVFLGLVLGLCAGASQPLIAAAAGDVQATPSADSSRTVDTSAGSTDPALSSDSAPSVDSSTPSVDSSTPSVDRSPPSVDSSPDSTDPAPTADSTSSLDSPAPSLDLPSNTVDPAPSRDSSPHRSMAPADTGLTLAAAAAIASSSTSGTVDQCNNTGSVGGDTITCTVTVTNNFTYNAATPNLPTGLATIVTEISCTGSAVCPTGGTTTSTTPVTVITQCNGAGLGGASTVTCTVTVTNNLTGYPIGAAIDSTVMQCQSPGAVDTQTCVATPPGDNRAGTAGPGGQSVTQCNSSGGAGGTLTCTVTAPPSQSTGLPTTINQCNASGTTGASTVTCTATITNNFIDSIPGGGGGGPGGYGPGGGGPGGGGPGTGPAGTGPPTADGNPPGTGTGPPITGGGNRLPFTGLDIRTLALLAVVMLLLGAALRTKSLEDERVRTAGFAVPPS